ncbi:DUF6691 family protein [Aeromonas rivuli]|jgi:uncharacterized protein|uniref:DUF6691 family protein n=1 Tax=Aeromonas TaxID=642 RepID=UPI0005AAAD59|nr:MULTISPECIES: DUF6691 family protein [Aeromonas]MCS3454525.1 putative membrane protein YedE/YeeE [Aeromonas sp. BIGb0405]UBO75250.1 YeeE/YedE family protein [Aeromonas rivuli]
MSNLISLLSGLLFGLGLVVSGMVDPARVMGFLDLFGQWDPSLAFVMGGALLVFAPGYAWLVKPRRQSLSGTPLPAPPTGRVDARLVGGAALFGVGWGLLGICPGPGLALLGVTMLGTEQPLIALFVLAMAVGLLGVDRLLAAGA